MNKVAAAVAIMVAIAGIFTAGGSVTNWTFDFSQTTTTTISDDDTTTINQGDTTFNIDKEDIVEAAFDINCQLDIIKDPDCP